MHAPIIDHFRALKRILHYVKGTYHYGLQLSRDSSQTLLSYFDVVWADYPITRLSTTGFSIYLGHNLISWCSKKQTTVLLPLLLRNSHGHFNFFKNSISPSPLLRDSYATTIVPCSLLPTQSPNLTPNILILTIILLGDLLPTRLLVLALSRHTYNWLMFLQRGWSIAIFIGSCQVVRFSSFYHANFEVGIIEDNLIPLIMAKISMILHNCSSLFSLYICFHVCNCTDTMHLLSINEYLLEAFPSQIKWIIFFLLILA